MKKFDEKIFYEKYVKKEVLDNVSYEKLNKFSNGCLGCFFFLPILSECFFSMVDLTAMWFLLYILFFLISFFFFVWFILSNYKLVRRAKKLLIFKDIKYFYKILKINALIISSIILFIIACNVFYALFKDILGIIMFLKFVFTLIASFSIHSYFYEKINREIFIGINKICLVKQKKSLELQRLKIDEEEGGVGPVFIRDNKDDEF